MLNIGAVTFPALECGCAVGLGSLLEGMDTKYIAFEGTVAEDAPASWSVTFEKADERTAF